MLKIVVVLCLLCPFAAVGGFYKCVVDGQTVYSQTECAADARTVDVDTSPTGFKPTAPKPDRNKLIREYREQNRRMRDAQERAAKKYQKKQKESKATEYDDANCEYYKLRHARYARQLRDGYKRGEEQRLKERKAYYDVQVKKYCK